MEGNERKAVHLALPVVSLPVRPARRIPCETREALGNAAAQLYLLSIVPAVEEGLCAAIYTQVSDVEDALNGLLPTTARWKSWTQTP